MSQGSERRRRKACPSGGPFCLRRDFGLGLAEFRIGPDAKIRDATWAVAYGLALWGLTGDTATPKKSLHTSFTKFFGQFLP